MPPGAQNRFLELKIASWSLKPYHLTVKSYWGRILVIFQPWGPIFVIFRPWGRKPKTTPKLLERPGYELFARNGGWSAQVV